MLIAKRSPKSRRRRRGIYGITPLKCECVGGCPYCLTVPADPTTATIRVNCSGWVNDTNCEVERFNGDNDLGYVSTTTQNNCSIYHYRKSVFSPFTQIDFWLGPQNWAVYAQDGCGSTMAPGGCGLQFQHAGQWLWAFEEDAGSWSMCDSRDLGGACSAPTVGTVNSVAFV